MDEQAGLIYKISDANIAKPNTIQGLRLFRKLSDGLYYVKDSTGALELFSAGLNAFVPLFQKVASVNNVGAGEDNLYTDSIVANTLAINGDTIQAKYAVKLADTANAKVIKIYFAGSKILTSVNNYAGGGQFDLDINVEIIRVDANTVKSIVSYVTKGISESQYTLISPVDFSIANDLAITGEGVADSDITAEFAKGILIPHN